SCFRKEIFQEPLSDFLKQIESTNVASQNVAPSVTARCKSNESRLLRLMAMNGAKRVGDTRVSNGISKTFPDRPAILTPVTYSALEATSSATPSNLKKSQHLGLMQSPQIFSRGNVALSQSSTRIPLRARSAAHVVPAGPAPIITTSKRELCSVVIGCTFR